MKKIAIVLTSLFVSASYANASVVSIYHTSDVHGSYGAHKAGAAFGDNSNKMIGGYPALISYLKMAEYPYLLLDSGDIFQGTPEGAASRGMASAYFMNLAGYDAVAAGNHDFDYGISSFKKISQKLKAAMLAANALPNAKGKMPKYIKPYVIIKKAGKRIAIIGLANKISSESGHSFSPEFSGLEDENITVRNIVKQVRSIEKPDAVILLNHSGAFGDAFFGKTINADENTVNSIPSDVKKTGLDMARLTSNINGDGIDLILGGHEHTALINGYYDKFSNTYFGESGTKLNYVTRADLYFNDITGKIENIKIQLVPLWIDVYGENKKALKLVKKYLDLVQKQMGKTIGYTKYGLSGGDGVLNNEIAQWVCNITKAKVNADISIQNASSFSIGLPAGKVTMQDLYRSMKFDNSIYKVQISGEGITKIIKDNFFTNSNSTLVYFSGIEIEYKNEPLIIKVKFAGKEIEAGRIYTVATNDYFFNVCKTGTAFKKYAVKVENTGFGVRETMQENLEATTQADPLEHSYADAYHIVK